MSGRRKLERLNRDIKVLDRLVMWCAPPPPLPKHASRQRIVRFVHKIK